MSDLFWQEEYVQTIQARMKLVAAKKGNADVPPSEAKEHQQQGDSYQLSDSDRSSFIAKVNGYVLIYLTDLCH